MRLRGERVAKEEDRGDMSFRDAAADDEVSPMRTVRHPLDVESEIILQKFAGAAGCDKFLAAKDRDVVADKVEQFLFHAVMGNESEHERGAFIMRRKRFAILFPCSRDRLALDT